MVRVALSVGSNDGGCERGSGRRVECEKEGFRQARWKRLKRPQWEECSGGAGERGGDLSGAPE